jgi:hypothetical protein
MLMAVSKEFNLLSCLTTFIAVEHRSVEERNDGTPALRRVPVQLVKGWGGVVDFAAAATPMMAKAMPGKFRAYESAPGSFSRARRRSASRGSYGGDPVFAMAPRASADRRNLSAAPPPAAGSGGLRDDIEVELKAQAPPDDLHGLLSLQSAEGWFAWDERAETLLGSAGGQSWRSRVEAGPDVVAVGAARERVVQTVLVLLLLAERFADRESSWRRAYRKACRQFLARVFGKNAPDVEHWLQALRSAL